MNSALKKQPLSTVSPVTDRIIAVLIAGFPG